MKTKYQNMPLEELLIRYSECCKPLTPQYIEQRTKEVFKDMPQIDLTDAIREAVKNA